MEGAMEQKIKQDFRIGPNIRKYRLQSHMTQEQVTAKMQLMGINISRSIYSQIEGGTYNIRVSELAAMRAFVEEAAVQCGFCTPGIIMSAVEIVGSGKQYTREELRKLISGHLCRCTGYQNILNAVERAVNEAHRFVGKGE